MKVLIKNNKWITTFENITVVFDVDIEKDYSLIKFSHNGKKIIIKSSDMTKTFKYLEKLFNKLGNTDKKEYNAKLVI